jgi:hypothetical protein
MAHNVGRSTAPGSPRGDAELDVGIRNRADNLLLLCGDHHNVIDDKVARGDYTVDELTRLKVEHESRIHYLTSLGSDQETVVIRIIGSIRGAAVELAEASVFQAIRAHAGRYPRNHLNFQNRDVEIDLRPLAGEGTAEYWKIGREKIREVLGAPLADGVSRGAIRHLSVFGMARIPLLAVVGECLDDKVPVDLYQKQRGGDEGWTWHPEAPAESFVTKLIRRGSGSEQVALLVSLSGTIDINDLPAEITDEYTIWEISPVNGPGHRDILRSHASLERFTSAYHGFLSMVEGEHAGAKTLALFPAVPTSAAISLGRGLMRDVHPAVQLYDRDENGSYVFAVELNR